MGVSKLKKAELYYHKSVNDQVAAVLQELGACQIIATDEIPDSNNKDFTKGFDVAEEHVAEVRYLIRTLTPHFDDPIPSLDRMLGERPEVTMNELENLAAQTDLKKLCEEVRNVERETGEVKTGLTQAKNNKDLLSNLAFFDFPLSVVTEGTKTVKGVVGTAKTELLDGLRGALGDFSKFAQDSELFLADFDNKKPPREIYAGLIYSAGLEKEILEAAAKNGVSVVDVPQEFKLTPKEELEKIESVITEFEAREKDLSAKIKMLANNNMPAVQQLSDYYNSMAGRYQEMAHSYGTESAMLTKFWIPTSEVDKLNEKINALGTDLELVLSDPAEEDEPPTLLQNGGLVRPFNILTELYSPPTYKGIDPTPLLAPFFWLFFGMCLGDAGYAIVMAGVIWYVFRKYKKIPSGIKDFIKLFAFCSVSTFLYGVVSGSFFGNFIDSFATFLVPLKNSLMLVDPMSNPMQVLGISLLLGVIHLMFGLLIAAYDKLRSGEIIDAIGNDLSWFMLIVGLCLLGTAMNGMLPEHFFDIGRAMAILGAVLIFIYAGKGKPGIINKIISGFLALYGSTSYLGDILSYSRLLALGFGSAVIGMVINLLGGLAGDIPYIGWLIGIVVIVGGHIFSILINILGAFVHPLRLQYVEFFGKFYSGGGKSFAPLRLSQEYVNVKA